MSKKKRVGNSDAFAKYKKLEQRVKVEGRIGGPCKCLYCGMRHLYQQGADDCCKL